MLYSCTHVAPLGVKGLKIVFSTVELFAALASYVPPPAAMQRTVVSAIYPLTWH